MALQFHAAPPSGWLNDPCGLVHAGGAYRLFAQHRTDGPAFERVGWARFSSHDLLCWAFDGMVIAPTATQSMYSGCVLTRESRLEAFHTVHDHARGLQHQTRRLSDDVGRSWRAAPDAPLTPPMRDCRDPFVLPSPADKPPRMLLARPCGWDAAGLDPPSRLELLEEALPNWRVVSVIGPYSPPGVLWEMPAVMHAGAAGDILFVSTVDRRGGQAASSVRAWLGALTAAGFERAVVWPAEGVLVDLGPDFYAMILAQGGLSVAWLSSWDTARRMPWPGFFGGPISLPRRIGLRRREGEWRLSHRPAPRLAAKFSEPCGESAPSAGLGAATIDGAAVFQVRIDSPAGAVTVAGDPQRGVLSVVRTGADWLTWRADHAQVLQTSAQRQLSLFLDGPAIELFIAPDDQAVTLALPVGGEALKASLEVGGSRAAFAFARLPEPRPSA